jgi:hypothetical protein
LPVDPLVATLDGARAVAALLILFVVPGLTMGPLLLPGAATPLHVIGRAIGLSLVITTSICTLLAGIGWLRPVPVLIAIGIVTLAPLASSAVRSSLRRRGGSGPRRAASWLRFAAAVAIVGAVVILPSRAAIGDDLLPRTSTPWYYAAAARDIADAGRIPPTIAEWGQDRPFPTDYVPASAHVAAALELLPGDDLVAIAWYRLAILGAAVAMAAVLLRRWVSSWLAVLGACLLLSTVRLEAKFLDLRPETFGLVLALTAVWATDVALAGRSRRAAAVALVASVLTFLSHAEVFLLLGPAFLGVAVARAVVTTGPVGLRWPRIDGLRSIALAGVLFGTAALLGAGVNAVFAGEFRLVGYVTDARERPAPVPADRIPAGWTFSGDPTWDFYVASVAPGQLGQPPPSFFFGSDLLPRATVAIWPGLDGRFRPDLLMLGGVVLLPALAWRWLDRRRRRLLVVAWAFGAALLVGSLALFSISSTYVPARIGPRRLMPYELIVPVVSTIVLLYGLDRLLRPGWRLLLSQRATGLATGVLLAVLTIGAVAPSSASVGDDTDEPGLTQTGYDALRWIDANLPADARILTNAYTDGSMLAVAHRAAILDGRAVYLEDAPFLAESTSLVLGARVLFADPNGSSAAAYLASERVTDVLVATAGPGGSDLGGYLLFDTNLAALAASDRYTQVRSFGGGRLLLYEVVGGP